MIHIVFKGFITPFFKNIFLGAWGYEYEKIDISSEFLEISSGHEFTK